ncbi:MAG: hypothetical protein IT228_08865 [Flavobacteriales bacterium]|nr:hypothetical protein [Flavobacteriales bacterium]MCC6577439.1 hypothetical protein [Flavobacteriales bacterium]NUQ16417.1 hypothetical protein [Flavobacteriales bacterium]
MLPARRTAHRHQAPPASPAVRRSPFDRLRWGHLVPVWFLGVPCVVLLARPTLLTTDGWLRLLGALVALIAVVARLLDRRYRFGPWASFIAGLFGGLPLLAILVLSLNRMVGSERTEVLRIAGIERRPDVDGLLLHLEGDAYADFPGRLRTAPLDPAVWSADRLRTTFRDGLLGFPVVLHQELLPGPPGHRAPDLTRIP